MQNKHSVGLKYLTVAIEAIHRKVGVEGDTTRVCLSGDNEITLLNERGQKTYTMRLPPE